MLEIRRRFPTVAALLLSQYDDVVVADELLEACQSSVGYLLKERITDSGQVLDALTRITAGEVVLDPQLIASVLGRRRVADPLAAFDHPRTATGAPDGRGQIQHWHR